MGSESGSEKKRKLVFLALRELAPLA